MVAILVNCRYPGEEEGMAGDRNWLKKQLEKERGEAGEKAIRQVDGICG